MKRFASRSWRTIAASIVLVAAGSALAQEPGSLSLEDSPFAPPKPGQSQDSPADLTPRGLSLGELDWAPIASRCTFVRSDASGKAKADPLPEPGRDAGAQEGFGRFVFVTMVADNAGDGSPLERGYVMANGLVRELEKGKTSAGKDKAVVTNWRAAGEPRISVGLILTGSERMDDHAEYTGKMTVFWGDKKEEVPVRGRCG
ncbi:hypothetical protein E3C22_19090 [Jiella endophytica]|uniref:Uncharacterized protein n=1 Tax=Jiella endophytica TaxID=2558362 RepID=A0A4Y8RCK0_9HYPH|nr:hypothetical protein [Jiella endophytica]TFF19789.1 hypothetical protein E3C22_19090 [Jiella endophytica]